MIEIEYEKRSGVWDPVNISEEASQYLGPRIVGDRGGFGMCNSGARECLDIPRDAERLWLCIDIDWHYNAPTTSYRYVVRAVRAGGLDVEALDSVAVVSIEAPEGVLALIGAMMGYSCSPVTVQVFHEE